MNSNLSTAKILLSVERLPDNKVTITIFFVPEGQKYRNHSYVVQIQTVCQIWDKESFSIKEWFLQSIGALAAAAALLHQFKKDSLAALGVQHFVDKNYVRGNSRWHSMTAKWQTGRSERLWTLRKLQIIWPTFQYLSLILCADQQTCDAIGAQNLNLLFWEKVRWLTPAGDLPAIIRLAKRDKFCQQKTDWVWAERKKWTVNGVLCLYCSHFPWLPSGV